MDDQNIQQEDSNTEGMTKGKSAKGMSKGKRAKGMSKGKSAKGMSKGNSINHREAWERLHAQADQRATGYKNTVPIRNLPS